MKQTLLFIAALFLFAGSYGQNLVKNGGFETWTDEAIPVLSDWDKAEEVTQETTIVHTGTYSAKHGPVTDTKKITQLVPITAGKSYKVSIWYYSVPGDETDSRIWSKWAGSDKRAFDDPQTAKELQGPNNEYFKVFNEWTEYSTTVVAPAAAIYLSLEVRSYKTGTTYWDDFSITEATPTGMDKLKSPAFSVYPNPFSTDLNIEGDDIVSIEIVNLAGQVILKTEANRINKITASALAKGVYILKITDANGNVQSKKVIKR